MNALRMLIVAFVLAFGATHVAMAGDTGTLDQATRARYHSLIAELRCVVCQNRSIAESDAPLAADLRDVVQRQILAGQTNTEIKHYLVGATATGFFMIRRFRHPPCCCGARRLCCWRSDC